MTDRELAREILNAEAAWLSYASCMHKSIYLYNIHGEPHFAELAMYDQFHALYWRDEYFELVRKTTYKNAWSDYTDLLNAIDGVSND